MLSTMELARPKRASVAAMSTIEIMVVLAIVVIIGGALVMNLGGLKASDKVDRAAQLIFNDILFIRSKAVGTSSQYRLNFTSNQAWTIDKYDSTAGTWSVENSRTLPTDTSLTDDALTNAGSNLVALPSGLFEFENSAIGTPFVTVQGYGLTNTKSIVVAVGGALSFERN